MIRVYSSFAQRRPSRPSTRSRPNRQRGTTVPPILFLKKRRQTSRQAFQGGLKVPKCFVPNKNNQGLKTWPTLWTVIICAHKKIRNGAKIRTLQTQWNPSIVMPDGCTTHKRFEKSHQDLTSHRFQVPWGTSYFRLLTSNVNNRNGRTAADPSNTQSPLNKHTKKTIPPSFSLQLAFLALIFPLFSTFIGFFRPPETVSHLCKQCAISTPSSSWTFCR